uniref:Secreted protein n=1 Tax=Caenorhabditis tropicalis TaxID=1561998 RepID=A0A1I7U8G1_9PELO
MVAILFALVTFDTNLIPILFHLFFGEIQECEVVGRANLRTFKFTFDFASSRVVDQVTGNQTYSKRHCLYLMGLNLQTCADIIQDPTTSYIYYFKIQI